MCRIWLTGINGSHNKAKVQGPGVVTGRSGSSVRFTTCHVIFGHWSKRYGLGRDTLAHFFCWSGSQAVQRGRVGIRDLRKAVHRVEILVPPGTECNY